MVSVQPIGAQRKVLVCAFACGADPAAKFFGGGDTMAWNIIRRLGRVHRLWVLTAAQNRKRIEAGLEKDPLPDVHFVYVDLPAGLHRLLSWPGGIQLYAYIWQWRAYFVARRLHKGTGFDAFHHLTYENDWMASPTGALLPVPYLRGPGGGAHRTPDEFARRYPLRDRLWERIRTMGQWIFRHDPFFILGQHRAKGILVCNQEALDAMPERWRHKARLFPVNGVPPEAFRENDYQAGVPGRFHIVAAGRLVRLKAFDLAIRAFAHFVERVCPAASADEVSLSIIGEGPEGERLEVLARGLGLDGLVRFAGWMPRAELWARMRSSDIFFFPSLRDGGGAVVIEAMAAGNPIVCVDLGGSGMHVRAECGVKVKPKTPEQVISDLSAALEMLYRHPELRRRMGSAARLRAERIYLWDVLAEVLLDVYQDAFGSRRERGPVPHPGSETRARHIPEITT
ncbi:MAG TPA: glycosyltransferase [Patescibacteria group bacterium]|nr:glycosyltransferase [Patescibacteria group bacterium]